MNEQVRRVATYERVSSEDQKERDSILTQTEELARRLASDPEVALVERYVDNAVSGMVPMIQREGGRRMLRDAEARRFEQLWVYKLNRLGRDAVDLLWVRRRLDQLGIRLISVVEGEQDLLGYDVHAVVNDYDRRAFLRHCNDGMNRAARDGRYTGGIAPLGYRVEGRKPHTRLVPSDEPMWADWSEADVARHIYHWLAAEEWSCRRIADELNALAVPTVYQKDGRGVRGAKTQGKWRAGRIRNLVVNPVYKGELWYGRRSTRPGGREIISAHVEPLVSEEIWDAAQATLAANRIMTKNGTHTYLLRGLIVCGNCGLHYCGSWSRNRARYRCGGQLVGRGQREERCPGKSICGEDLEAVVWADTERFLRDPGEVLKELASEREMSTAAAVSEAQRTTLEAALHALAYRRRRLLDLYERGSVEVAELESRLAAVREEEQAAQERLDALTEETPIEPPALDVDLLSELRRRLDQGLDDAQRHEVVRLLVRRITIHTEVVDGRKKARAVVEYRFPDVVNTHAGRGSWPPPA